MSKKLTLAAIAAVTIIGSLFFALASNLFFSDISNFGGNIGIGDLAATFTSATFACLFPAAIFFLIRYYLHPKALRKLGIFYLSIFMTLSVLGIVFALIAGFIKYGSFIAPYPFPGYLIVFIVLHVLVLAACGYGVFRLKKVPADQEVIKMKATYILSTIGWFLFICLVFNRFGMLMGAPLYAQASTFYMTFPFYMFLLVPVCIGALVVLIKLEFLSAKLEKILLFVALGVTVALALAVVLIGIKDSTFISAISAALPLERLASMPLETIIHIVAYLAVLIIYIVLAFKKPKEVKE